MSHSSNSVFLDPSGKRWRAIRRATLAVGILSTLVVLGLAVTFLVPPILPNLQAAKSAIRITHSQNRLVVTRDAARKRADRQQLLAALTRKPALPATHTERLPIAVNRATEPAHATMKPAARPRGAPIVAGFYVNWDDNSFSSFKAHVTDLDWVVGEWVLLSKGGTGLKITPDAKVLYVIQNLPEKDRPRVFAMVSNFDGKKFDAALLRRLLATPASRQAAAIQLVDAAQKYGLAGITIDFEEVPDDLLDPMFAFMGILRAGLTPGGRLLTSAVAAGTDEALARRYAAADDYLFLMLYDEHYGNGDPGPVASQSWYIAKAKQLLAWIPPEKSILALGAYGYDWNDAGTKLAGLERSPSRTPWCAPNPPARPCSSIPFHSILTSPTATARAPTTSPGFSMASPRGIRRAPAQISARPERPSGASALKIPPFGTPSPTTCRTHSRSCSKTFLPDTIRSSRGKADCCASPRIRRRGGACCKPTPRRRSSPMKASHSSLRRGWCSGSVRAIPAKSRSPSTTDPMRAIHERDSRHARLAPCKGDFFRRRPAGG